MLSGQGGHKLGELLQECKFKKGPLFSNISYEGPADGMIAIFLVGKLTNEAADLKLCLSLWWGLTAKDLDSRGNVE